MKLEFYEKKYGLNYIATTAEGYQYRLKDLKKDVFDTDLKYCGNSISARNYDIQTITAPNGDVVFNRNVSNFTVELL